MNGVSLHLLINHFPLAALLIALGIGLWTQFSGNRTAFRLYWVLSCIAFACLLPVLKTGEAALAHLAATQSPALDERYAGIHEQMAHDFIPLYITGLVTHLGLGLGLGSQRLGSRWPRRLTWITLAILLLNLLVLAIVAHSGGEIRHTHLR
ncbi:MAG: hypothetical protein KF690_05455 [Bacteroidetes bacterium]|nr:hypothetical protein [Bacteroidota bacterium]